MNKMPHILAGLAYLLGGGALALGVGPLWGLAGFAAAVALHGIWWGLVLASHLETAQARIGELRRDVKFAREEIQSVLEAIESMASKNAEMANVSTELRFLKGLVEQLSGKPITLPGEAPHPKAPPKPNLPDAQVLDMVREALREPRRSLSPADRRSAAAPPPPLRMLLARARTRRHDDRAGFLSGVGRGLWPRRRD